MYWVLNVEGSVSHKCTWIVGSTKSPSPLLAQTAFRNVSSEFHKLGCTEVSHDNLVKRLEKYAHMGEEALRNFHLSDSDIHTYLTGQHCTILMAHSLQEILPHTSGDTNPILLQTNSVCCWKMLIGGVTAMTSIYSAHTSNLWPSVFCHWHCVCFCCCCCCCN